MQTINISALDTLFFRGGKPFTMGQETTGSGLFPPSPSVIYGALRTAYFAENQMDFKQFQMNTKDATEHLTVRHIAYLKRAKRTNKLYFPAPLDLVTEDKKAKDKKAFLLQSEDFKKDEVSNSKTPQILRIGTNKPKVEDLLDAFISEDTLEEYLNSPNNKDFLFENLEDFITVEPKVGVGLNRKTRTAEEGQLYFIGMTRPRNKENIIFDINITFSDLKLPDNGVLRMGGEGKSAMYQVTTPIQQLQPDFEGATFKLYLSTPTLFKEGWLPKWIDKNTFTGTFPNTNTKVKLTTCAIGKPVSIGGFDVKKQQPKPMLRAVPAGSVYYFEIENGNIKDIIDALKKSPSICEYRAKEGFGLAFIGKIK